jgi:hypothetical protein
MAQKDEYVNSDTSNGRSKELINDPLQPIYHTNVATNDCQNFFGDSKNSIDIVRVGLNYRFVSAAPAPVLARY